jgi:type IV secretion system protein VirD4
MKRHLPFIKPQIFCSFLLITICSFTATAQTANRTRSTKPGATTIQANNAGRSTAPDTMRNQSRDQQPPSASQDSSQTRASAMSRVFDVLFSDSFFSRILLMVLPVFVILLIILFFFTGNGGNVGRKDSHGGASIAGKEDLKEFVKPQGEGLKAGEFGLGEASKGGNFYALPQLLTYRHVLILGATGTGKSRGFYLPNLELLAGTGASVFVNDTKSELWNTASGYWKRAVRFAPLDPGSSSPLNWIPLCTDENQTLTLKLARTIITNGGDSKNKEAFWDKAETALLAALFAHVATTETPTPAFAYDILHERDMNGVAEILFSSKSRLARQQARVFWDAGDKLRGSVFTGARVSLTWLGDAKIRRFTSSTLKPINFAEMRAGKTGVFWCLPVKAIATLRPLTALVLTLTMEQLKETKGSPVYMMLDEFANIGAIPDFSTEITLLRSERVPVIAGIQSFAQLAERYGHDAARTIAENFQTKLVLAGLEFDSAERISKHLGELTIIERRDSHTSKGWFGEGASRTRSLQKYARRLLTANEITQLADDEVLIVSANKKPFIAQKWFYNKKAVQKKAQTCGAVITGELPPQQAQLSPMPTQFTPSPLPQATFEYATNENNGGTVTNGAKQTLPPEMPSFDD